MADSDVSAVKVYNYICGIGGFAEFSQLLRHPSPLAKKSNAISVMVWFEMEKKSGSFDSDHHLSMITNQFGQGFGIRVTLKKQMCLKYTTDCCKSAKRCKFWHICKEFIEGTCKGNCGRSHDFHDEDNKGKTAELGFEKKSNTNIKSIVVGSSLQVCHSYLKNECVTDNCPYLHICSSQVRATPCECSLSHDFADSHNKRILEQYGFKPPRTLEIDVVRCNVFVPKQQKPIEDNKRLLEFSLQRQMPRDPRQQMKARNSNRQTAVASDKTEMSGTGKSKTPPKVKAGAKPVFLSGLVQQAGKAAEMTSASPTLQQATVTHEADPLLDKVFNYICGKGGLATLSDLLQHPSPLAKKFSAPGQEMDLKIWLQVQAQPDQNPRISLLENGDGEVFGARVNLKKKICLHYSCNGSCTRTPCWFWHICKQYLQGKCSGDCGLSHDFHDESNIKNLQKLGLENLPSGTVRNIVAHSLPQVCLMYLNNKCLSESCPYLHICSHPIITAQGISWGCSCSLSHDLNDDHNMGILKQYELVPQPSKLKSVHCNILIPNKQRSFVDDKTNLGPSLSFLPQTHLNKFSAEVPSLMTLQITQQNISGSQQQDSRKSSEKKKKKKQRTRKRNHKTNQQGEPTEESQGTCANSEVFGEESSDDSVSDNEDTEKPDLYTTSKFAVNPSEQELTRNAAAPKQPFKGQRSQFPEALSQEGHISGMDNLINLSDDDDWQGADAAVDDLFTNDLLSQVDEIFFDDWFGPSNAASSLSQGSAFSSTSDQNASSSEGTHSEKSAVNSIFQCICKEYNGQVPFSEISQRQELFPPDIIDVSAWFKANPNRFMTIENKAGKIEAIRAYNPKTRICFRYLLTKNGCKDPKCFRYHVCNHYLANGVCPFGKKCRYSHSHNLKSPHNKNITRQLRLNSFSEEQLRILISASVPEVCLDYNKHSCQRGFRCNGIHICKYFLTKNCKNGGNCPLGHTLETPEAKLVLGRYNLSKIPPHAVLGALLVRSTGKTIKDASATEPVPHKREVPRQPRYICLDNLLGHCSKEPLCDQYHCSSPYMWQYQDPCGDGNIWKAFTANENEDIEKQFCNVNITVAEMKHIMISTPPSLLIDPGDGEIQIHFDGMKAVTSFGDVQLRRLSTKSAVLPTDHALLTQWIWYWMDESNIWKEYEPLGTVKHVHEQIESTFMSEKPFFKFKVDGEVHRIYFRESPMCQRNTKPPITTKRVSRRPLFRSTSETQELQRPLELSIPLEPESPLTTGAPGRLPSQWTSVSESEEYNRVPLPASSDQYKLAESLFRQTMSENKATIVAVERVQNPFMWEKYARKKEQMEKRSRTKNSPANEKLLFHGTDHKNVDTICEENIDWRALDEDRAAAFGEGAYFTEQSALSNLYCKQDSESMRYMFLAEVLVGSWAKGEPSMKRPPYKTDSASKKELYDSCVDNVERPTIFVLFDSDQYYPSFLIQYKIKSKEVYNKNSYSDHCMKKEQLEKSPHTKNSPVNEKLLFHGSDHQNVDTICEENIDWRALDEGRSAAFGEGAYFTEQSCAKGDLPSNVKDNSPWKDTSILSNIVTSEGGLVVKDSVKLVCPPGAVETPVYVNITLVDPSNYYGLLVQKDLENDVMFVAPIINLEPSGHLFEKPLTLVTKFKINNFKWDDVLILHRSKARDGKITWQDITFNSKIDEANAEVIIETEHFSLIAVLVRFSRSTLIRTKEIVSRLNLLSFNYTLSVLLNKSSPSSLHDELALLFVSQDVYHEQFYREDETSSALMQLKKDGFVELHVCSITRQEEKSIYNNENLQINVHLGEDYKLADRQQENTSFTVHSDVWWNAGMVIRLPLEWKKDVRSLCGKISVQGEYGHTSEKHFSERDLCGYVRSLLSVEGAIFNLIPIAQLLGMPEESMHEAAKCWKDEEKQLELILQHWSKKNDVVEDLAALRKDLESLQQKDYMVTKRGQMHIRHLRKLATKISSLQCVNADLVNYFERKIQTLCKSVLRDCCVELEGSIEAASSESYTEYLIQSIKSHVPPPEDIARKYQQVCSSSEKAITKTFLIIVPYLIQNIKDIFVDERISEEPQNGLRGLPKEKLDYFVSCVRIAEGNNRFHELVCESCNILEQLCLKNHDKQPTAEIEKWGKSLTILPMLNFLKPFFQHCRQDVRLHQRLDLFSCRLRDIMANHEDIDEIFVHDLSNLLLSLVHFAKFDPSKLVRFELVDSTNVPLICPRENVRYDKHEHTYSQVFRIKKESEGQLRLHAIAHVYINGNICEKGTFQSEIMLKASSEEAFHECSIHFEDVTVVKLEDNADTENRRVVLCSTQKEKLSELLDVLKQKLSKNEVAVNQSEVTQCHLTMRTVTTKAGVVVSLRLVYKWGSEAVFPNSDDFETFADLSTGCLCMPEEQVVDLRKEGQLQQLSLATDNQPEEGSTIRDNANDLQIFIKMMNGRKVPLAVEPNDFIKNVKKKIQQLNECPPDRQRLVFVGKKLEDDLTLSDYNVQNGSTLILLQRLRDAPMDDAG